MEFEVGFEGKVIVDADNEEDAFDKAYQELSWSNSRFDLTGCEEM